MESPSEPNPEFAGPLKDSPSLGDDGEFLDAPHFPEDADPLTARFQWTSFGTARGTWGMPLTTLVWDYWRVEIPRRMPKKNPFGDAMLTSNRSGERDERTTRGLYQTVKVMPYNVAQEPERFYVPPSHRKRGLGRFISSLFGFIMLAAMLTLSMGVWAS